MVWHSTIRSAEYWMGWYCQSMVKVLLKYGGTMPQPQCPCVPPYIPHLPPRLSMGCNSNQSTQTMPIILTIQVLMLILYSQPLPIRAFKFSRIICLGCNLCDKNPTSWIRSQFFPQRFIHSLSLFIMDVDINIWKFVLWKQLSSGNLGSSQEVWRRLTEPPGRRSTRPSILGPCSKTLVPLAKEPALLASYWPRSRTGCSHWSRLWVGRNACLESSLIPPNHNFE